MATKPIRETILKQKSASPRFTHGDEGIFVSAKRAKTPKTIAIVNVTPTVSAGPIMQINFEGSEAFARLIDKMRREHGSTRLAMALVWQKAGYDVPAEDLAQPRVMKRRFE